MSCGIVIVGGGIMGCATAYWISQLRPNEHITIVEMEGIASSSSGKAGGFLARGWHGGGRTQQLHEVGFDLIEEFASKHQLKSYRKVPMYSLSHHGNSRGTELPWLDNRKVTYSLDDPTTAQITPKELTEALLKYAGGNIETKIGMKVVGVQTCVTNSKCVESVTVLDVKTNMSDFISCKSLIVCTGAWTSLLSSWFPQKNVPCIRMEGIKSSSIVYQHNAVMTEERAKLKSQLLESPGVLFCDDDENGCHLEVYPRPNGDIYCCGLGGSPQLSANEIKDLLPADVTANMNRVELAHSCFMKMTSHHNDDGGLPELTTACLRPITPDSLPVMGPVVDVEGVELDNVYVNAGHNCWGILWSCVSGKVMAELVVEGEGKCINLKPFLPKRFVRKSKYR